MGLKSKGVSVGCGGEIRGRLRETHTHAQTQTRRLRLVAQVLRSQAEILV